MTAKQAIEILENHNNWRRELVDKTVATYPKQLEEAIDIVIKLLKLYLKENNINKPKIDTE